MTEDHTDPSGLLIIGTGLAGYTLAREYRKAAPQAPITVVTADDGRFYSKPLLSTALAQGKTPDQLASASAEEMASQLNLRVITQTQVTAIDPANRKVLSASQSWTYQRLALAVGARQTRPPVSGTAAHAVQTVNDLAQYARFRESISQCRRVLIIGGGLIGCEFGNDLAHGGYTVHVVNRGALPMDTLVPPAIGAAVQEALASLGVRWHTDNTVASLDRQGDALRATLADGTTLDVDVVLSATGLAPNTALADNAGLDTRRGIVVDSHLRTSDTYIYALGDCAEVYGRVQPFVMPLMEQARSLAKTLAGQPSPLRYPVMPVVVKTPAHPVCIVPPPPDCPGDWEVDAEEAGIRALFKDSDGHLRGFGLSGQRVKERGALTRQITA